MSLTREYSRKINRFADTVPRRMYSLCEKAGFSGFITHERLSIEEASAHERSPFSEGTAWGKKWEYGWFFTEVTIPEACKGQRIVFKASLGECLVFVNGKIYGSLDKQHFEVTLAKEAKGGEHFEIAMEVYAGHSGKPGVPDLVDGAPLTMVVIPEENIAEFPENVTQRVIKDGEIGIFHEDVFQFMMDFNTLRELRGHFPETSWRQAGIDKCLEEVCDTVNIEEPLPVFIENVKKAREIMAPVLACKNGTSAPTMYAVGNSHLDLEWLWTAEETRRKAARTLGNQLRLMEEYDDYKYMHSQPWLLASVKKDYPKLYEEVKEWVKKGRIIVEGGMWVESDTNIPAGESLIRQFIFGKRFLAEEFGVESEILWLPDVFGLNGALPQIMKGCGINYLLNAKLNFIYSGGDGYKYSNFVWQGIDGSEVLVHHTHDYATNSSPDMIFNKWESNHEKGDVPARLFMYGHGDGGGGATRMQQEFIRRERDLEGMPKVEMKAPIEFYHFVEKECEIRKKYRGELYYAAHRGTYTTQAKTKKLNRQSERALHEAEMWTAFLEKNPEVREEIDPLWEEVLFNQFHDILPGSSITAVYERAEKSFAEVIKKAEVIREHALLSAVEDTPDTITVFNSLSWDRKVLVSLPKGYQGVYDSEDNLMETQCVDGQSMALIDVLSCGSRSYKLQPGSVARTALTDAELYLDNNLIRADFDHKGQLISVKDKNTGMEFLSAPSNRFRMYQNAPTFFDAWDIDSFYEKLEVTEEGETEVIVENRGPLMSSLLVKKIVNGAEIRQRIVLRADSSRIDFETEVDWNQTHKLLKVDFNTNIHTEDMISEIQFGHLKRPTHRNRQHDADRFEVCQHKWSALAEANRGFAVLNDSKYGIGADEGRMHLTLLTSSAAPALHADRGLQKFTYSVMPFSGAFYESDVVREAYELNNPVSVRSGKGADCSLLRVSEKNVIVETVKFAEDGSGSLIVRLYECQNAHTNCKLEFGFDVKEVYYTDMLENLKERAVLQANVVTLEMKPFQIVTLKVYR